MKLTDKNITFKLLYPSFQPAHWVLFEIVRKNVGNMQIVFKSLSRSTHIVFIDFYGKLKKMILKHNSDKHYMDVSCIFGTPTTFFDIEIIPGFYGSIEQKLFKKLKKYDTWYRP